MLRLDAIRLCAQLTVMVTDDTQYEQFVNLRGLPTQGLLNLLQAVCDSTHFQHSIDLHVS